MDDQTHRHRPIGVRAPAALAALALGCALALAAARPAAAQPRLPYGARTQPYSGWSTYVQGDIRTIGMGGATTGLADTFIAAVSNPAGLAMTLRYGDIHYASNAIHDGHTQAGDGIVETSSLGVALGFHPWAISVGYLAPYREDAIHQQSFARFPARLSVLRRELLVSAACLLWQNRLSVGAGLVLGQAVRAIETLAPGGDEQSYASYTAGVIVGGMLQLPHRLLVGASFSSPMHFGGGDAALQGGAPLGGFFQPVEVPWRAGLGLGYIPNRFLRADLSLHFVGPTHGAALLRDQAARVGDRFTLQPRLGAAYIFADYRDLKATLFLGTYYETTRIAGAPDRLHATAGAEARLWVITFGGAIDLADQYLNYQFSVGVDVFDLMQRLEMIPTPWSPPHAGMLPRPNELSDVGLARPLVKDWRPQGPDIDPIKAGLELPKNFGKGINNVERELRHVGTQVQKVFKPPPRDHKPAGEKR